MKRDKEAEEAARLEQERLELQRALENESKIESPEEKLQKQLDVLLSSEKISASAEIPLGDNYHINSVEEFYGTAADLNLKETIIKTQSTPKKPLPPATNNKDEWELVTDASTNNSIRVRKKMVEMTYKELWADRQNRIRVSSKYGHLPGWSLKAAIVKAEDDLRQEQMAMQLISVFSEIYSSSELSLWVFPYSINATSRNTGFIECIPDAISIDAIKKKHPTLNAAGTPTTLSDYYIAMYGERTSHSFLTAQKNFVESLAGYSIICYLLQIKDRHNGNIMIDIYGHLIHIDYGFLLTSSPGNMGWETAPFKLTTDYVDLMGGLGSDMFKYFKLLWLRGFLEVRKHYEKIVMLVEMMLTGSTMGCMGTMEGTIDPLKQRFKPTMNDTECVKFIENLINESWVDWTSRTYDTFQYWTVGIMP
eukprot:TRINITY_DN25831_c0_g1_i1.p1 TRINITY_DN25831_c0_g1~~TRINITY_DN25831_c0_g1_i1.p1  ORF type:complete len:421 (-),score=90.87 TRINITY_DN25831_c0_g1_i1:67-1329(-)